MQENKTTGTQLPLVLKVLSVGLILCPIGNFLISYYISDIRQQFGLSQIFEILPLIRPIDWAWNGLVAVSGILILQRRKLSWLIAILAILFCTVINIYKFIALPNVAFGWGYLIMTFTISLGAALIIGYFRYPYLDRRDRWISLNRRTEVKIPVNIIGGPARVVATNISATGARLQFPDLCEYVEGQPLDVKFENHVVESKLIWRQGNVAGITFVKPDREFKRWAKSRGQ